MGLILEIDRLKSDNALLMTIGNQQAECMTQIDQLAKQARRDINHGRPPEAIKSLDRIIELLKGGK